MQAVVMVEALCQSVHTHRQQIDFTGMARATGRAGFVKQPSEGRRIDPSGNPPGVIEQGRNYAQGDMFSGKLPVCLPSQQHMRKLAVRGPLARKTDVGSFGVALQQWRLRGLGQVAPEKAGGTLEVFNVLGGEMKARVRKPSRPNAC